MRFLLKFFVLVLVLAGLPAWGLINYPLTVARLIPTLPSIERLPLNPATPTTVTKSSSQLLKPIEEKYVFLKDVPQTLLQAVVAVEDERFFQHKGIDPQGIGRALFNNLLKQSWIEGGSTITQQLARNLYLNQTPTAERKLTEAFLALQLEDYYEDKNKLLELYINNIYFGRNAWGIGSAAAAYLGKDSISLLTAAECAFLAGLPQSPSYFAENIDAAQTRQKLVIEKMKELGYLPESYKNVSPKIKAWNPTVGEEKKQASL